MSAEGAVSQAGWITTAALLRLSSGASGPRWASWSLLFLPDVSQNNYYFHMCSELMLNVARMPGFLYCAPVVLPVSAMDYRQSFWGWLVEPPPAADVA